MPPATISVFLMDRSGRRLAPILPFLEMLVFSFSSEYVIPYLESGKAIHFESCFDMIGLSNSSTDFDRNNESSKVFLWKSLFSINVLLLSDL